MEDWIARHRWLARVAVIIGIPFFTLIMLPIMVLLVVVSALPPLRWFELGYDYAFVLYPLVAIVLLIGLAIAVGVLAPMRRRFSRRRQG